MADQYGDYSRVSSTLMPINDPEPGDKKEHHHGHHGTSVGGAIFSVVCITVGAGILSIPGGVAAGGWVAIPLIIVIAIMCVYTAQLIGLCMHAIPDRHMSTYEEIGEAAMGKPGKILVGIFQTFTLFGICTIFLILIGGNLSSIIPQLTLHDWVFIAGAVMIPISWLKTVKEISILAYFGTFASIYVGITVIVLGIINVANNDAGVYYWSKSTFPVAFNTIVFSFAGQSVLPAIEYSMAEPEKWPLVTTVGYSIIGVIYTSVAIFGYLGWGDLAQSNILSNMDSSSVPVIIATAIITFHIFCAYPLPLNPLNLQLESALGFELLAPKKEFLFRVILRSCVVLTTVVIASVVPFFGDVLNLVSSLSMTAIAFVFPPIFYVILYRKQVKISLLEFIVIAIVIVVALLGAVVGVYFAITGLISDIESQNPFENFFVPAKDDSNSGSSDSGSGHNNFTRYAF